MSNVIKYPLDFSGKVQITMKGNIQKTAAFLSNGLVYGLNGIYLIMPLFLAKYFDTVETGFLLAIQPFLLCIAPLFWGGLTDRAKSQNNVLILIVTGAAISICSLRLSSNFIFVAAALAFYSFFQAPFGSLVDILTIKSAEKHKMNYGFFRIAGSVAYGLMAYLITLLSKTENFVAVYAVMSVAAVVCAALMTKVRKVEVSENKKQGNFFELVKNKELWLLISILGLAFFTWGYYANFFPTYITETLGLDKSIWGIVAFLTAFSELPFFIYYSKIFRKFSMKTIVTVSSLAILIRWVVFATVKDTALLIIISFVTGMFITVLTYCVTFYIVSAIAPQLANRAQSIMYAIGTGIPKMLAGCVGGYMTEYLGEPLSFSICALISLSGLLLGLIFSKTMSSIDEKVRRYR